MIILQLAPEASVSHLLYELIESGMIMVSLFWIEARVDRSAITYIICIDREITIAITTIALIPLIDEIDQTITDTGGRDVFVSIVHRGLQHPQGICCYDIGVGIMFGKYAHGLQEILNNRVVGISSDFDFSLSMYRLVSK